MTTSEACDLIVSLTAELRDAHALVASLTDDVASYRLVAQQALHALHDLTCDRDRLREQHRRLLEEYRQLRDRTRREARAA